MRVAIQISGQQRYGEFFAQFLASMSIFDDIDFFVHHWEGPRSADEIAAIVPNIRSISIEQQKQFEVKPEWSLLHPQGSSIFNLMSMTYGIWAANELRRSYQVQTGKQYAVFAFRGQKR